MKIKRIMAASIAAALMLTNTAFASYRYATRGEAAQMLLNEMCIRDRAWIVWQALCGNRTA